MKKVLFFPSLFLLLFSAILFTSCEKTSDEPMDLSTTQSDVPEDLTDYYWDLFGSGAFIKTSNLEWIRPKGDSPKVSLRSGHAEYDNVLWHAAGHFPSGLTITARANKLNGEIIQGRLHWVGPGLNFTVELTSCDVLTEEPNVVRWCGIVTKIKEGLPWATEGVTVLAGLSQDNGEGASSVGDKIAGAWPSCEAVPGPGELDWDARPPIPTGQIQVRAW